VAQDHALQRGVVGAGRAPDRLVGVGVVDRRDRLLEAQHVRPVRLAPGAGGQHWRAGRQRHDREALERARRGAEELDVDAVAASRILVEGKDDDAAAFEEGHDPVERAALADHPETGPIEAPGDQRVEPARLDRPPDEVEASA
jgi:hypothetical protein